MKSQIEFALGHPVFDPDTQIVAGHYWWAAHDVSACLTANIGMS
jgi:predicted alpha-1,6-mannanase (GH76 family)